MLDYKIITGKHHAIRRSNRETFLDRKREAETTHEISILMICYNHIDQFFAALERVHREAVRNNLVITIVQNSDQEEALHTFEERIIPYTHINVLYPKQNLGSAGGYAFGQEYVLSK